MGFRDLQKELTSGFKSPIYTITSSEEFLLRDCLKTIKDTLKLPDHSVEVFDLLQPESTITATSLVELLNMLPLMTERRVVFVNHSERFNKKDISILQDYASDPSPFSQLILLVEVQDKKTSGFELKGSRQIDLSLSQKTLKDWLTLKAQGMGYRFTEEALEYLLEITGDNPGLLYSETLKFATLGKAVVDVHDISGLVYSGADYGVFEMIEHLKRGDVKETLIGSYRLQDVEPFQVLGALCWHYVTRQGVGRSKDDLIRTLRVLHDTDLLIKRGALCAVDSAILRLLKVID